MSLITIFVLHLNVVKRQMTVARAHWIQQKEK